MIRSTYVGSQGARGEMVILVIVIVIVIIIVIIVIVIVIVIEVIMNVIIEILAIAHRAPAARRRWRRAPVTNR